MYTPTVTNTENKMAAIYTNVERYSAPAFETRDSATHCSGPNTIDSSSLYKHTDY